MFTRRWFRRKKIILASGSPRRKELLDLTGLKYQVINPGVDEKQIPELIEKSRGSSMSGNPIRLTDSQIADILRKLL